MSPIVIALGSAAVYGVADYFGGRAARQLPAVRVAAVGESISLVVVIIIVLLAGTPSPDTGTWVRGAMGGIANAAGQTLLYWSLARGAMSVVAPITAAVGATVPVLIGLASGDHPAPAGYLGIAVGCIAVALVSRAIHEHTGRQTPTPVLCTAALAGVGFGVMFTLYHDLPPGAGLWPVVSARLAAVPLLWMVTVAGRRAISGRCPASSPRRDRRPLIHAASAGQLDMAGTVLYLVATRDTMLSVVAVFVPAFFMTGVSRSLFVPLAFAVAFSMVASFLLSSTLVPVLAVWWLRSRGRHVASATAATEEHDADWVDALRRRLATLLERLAPARVLVVLAYLAVTLATVGVIGPRLGREIFPASGVKAFQLRFRAPAGTKFETTEVLARNVLNEIREEAGTDGVAITLGYVGVQPSSYPINTIFLWTGGSHEGVLQVSLNDRSGVTLDRFEERLRRRFREKFPNAQFSFEPGDIVSRIMNFGSPTPVEVAVMGPDFAATRTFAAKLRDELSRVEPLRDLQYGQTLDYPGIQVNVNREMAGQLGVTVDQIGRSFAAATSSSRFVAPNYWADPRTGIAFQVQVQVPQPQMTSLDALRVVPVVGGSGRAKPMLGDVARIDNSTIVGEYDRVNGQRMVTLTANVSGADLGRTLTLVNDAIGRAGTPPRGATVAVRGQIAAMQDTFSNIAVGLGVAVLAIFLLLAANFQSVRLAVVVVSTVPAALAGVAVMLWATGTTVNVQSFMGAIMAIGVAVANAILLVTFAERRRRSGGRVGESGIEAARSRMRPVLMTSAAMIAGMIPMALALGEGADATAPLGRAVIGGLAAATLATLLILPFVYALLQRGSGPTSPSLDPDDPESLHRTAVS